MVLKTTVRKADPTVMQLAQARATVRRLTRRIEKLSDCEYRTFLMACREDVVKAGTPTA